MFDAYMNKRIEELQKALEPLMGQLQRHPIYSTVNSMDELRCFMQEHAFAVWDFMSLLKYLQKELTCVHVPWKPVGSAKIRRFINEIVLGEESDIDIEGNCSSHYEMYLAAMDQVGANRMQIDAFFKLVCSGVSVRTALKQAKIQDQTKDFVQFSMDCIDAKKPHVVAAVFAFGREDLIPDMFSRLLKELNQKHSGSFGKLKYYLDRHIEVDGDHHGPLSMQMIAELCQEDPQKWDEAKHYAKKALQHRIQLWNGVLMKLVQPISS